MGYLICVGLANVFYTFGYWSERILKPRSPERYRRIAYAAGVSLSVALAFFYTGHDSIVRMCRRPARMKSPRLNFVMQHLLGLKEAIDIFAMRGEPIGKILLALAAFRLRILP